MPDGLNKSLAVPLVGGQAKNNNFEKYEPFKNEELLKI
jgi:hypothetical protein